MSSRKGSRCTPGCDGVTRSVRRLQSSAGMLTKKILSQLLLLMACLFSSVAAHAWTPTTAPYPNIHWDGERYPQPPNPATCAGGVSLLDPNVNPDGYASGWLAGPGAGVQGVCSNTISLIAATDITSTSFAQAQTAGDYLYVNLTVNSLADLLRITQFDLYQWNSYTENVNTTFYTTSQNTGARGQLVLVDPLGNPVNLGGALTLYGPRGTLQTVSALTNEIGNLNLSFPQTYQLRMYLWCSTSACGTMRRYGTSTTTSNVVFFDSPVLTYQYRQLALLRKTWVNATVGDTATITPAGTTPSTAFVSTANSLNETDTSGPYDVATGSVFNVSETVTTGYGQALSCTRENDSGAVASITPPYTVQAADRAIICTYTNTRLAAPTLTVAKQIVSRASTTDQFTVNIKNSGGTTTYASATTSGTGLIATSPTYTATPGTTYLFDESASAGTGFALYSKRYSCTNAYAASSTVLPAASGTSFTLTPQAGDAITCTFVNDPTPTASLTLQKVVSGGTSQVSDWTLTAAGSTTYSGLTGSSTVTAAQVEPGTYALSEAGPSGYTASDYSCVKNGGTAVSGNSISLVAGDTAVCTITNTAITGPIGGTPAAPLTCPVGQTLYTLGVGLASTNTTGPLTTAMSQSYNFGTTGVSLNVAFSGVTPATTNTYPLSGNDPAIAIYEPGGESRGDIVNSLSITSNVAITQMRVQVADVDSALSCGWFDCSIRYRDAVQANGGVFYYGSGFSVGSIGGGASNLLYRTSNNSTCGNTSTSCDVAVGWGSASANTTRTLSFISYHDTGTSTQQAIGYDTIQMCVANPTLNIIKDAIPDSPQSFAFDGAGTAAPGGTTAATNATWPDFSLVDNGGSAGIKTYSATSPTERLLPGSYTITEGTLPVGWTLSDISCTDPTGDSSGNVSTRQASIQLAAGETVTCTFTNRSTLVDLSITKTNSASEVTQGAPTTYTVVVTNNGPATASNAIARDVPGAGLGTCSVTGVTATGGAVAPAASVWPSLLTAGGLAIPTLPTGGSVTFTVQCPVE